VAQEASAKFIYLRRIETSAKKRAEAKRTRPPEGFVAMIVIPARTLRLDSRELKRALAAASGGWGWARTGELRPFRTAQVETTRSRFFSVPAAGPA